MSKARAKAGQQQNAAFGRHRYTAWLILWVSRERAGARGCYNGAMTRVPAREEPGKGGRLAEARARYVHALERALERAVKELRAMPEVQRVILFGSYATGRKDLLTDLDLLVVMESDQEFVTRTARLYQKLEPGVDLDLLVYTPAEFERLRGSGFVGHAATTGKVLYATKPAR